MKIIKISIKLILILIVITLISIIWVNRELNRSKGAFTDVIDMSEVVKPYDEIIIKNVNIITPDCKEFIPNQNVVLKDGIIKSINQDSIFGNNSTIVDGQDNYLIPGLVDSHVHLKNSKNDLLLYLANGVTYIREMSGNLDHIKWKEEVNAGKLGPKMFIASEKVNSKSGFSGYFESWTRNRINYSNVKAANKKIKQLHDRGFDAVKISTFINKEMHKATIRAANKYDLPVIGHVPISVGIDSIITSGQSELAHVEEITKSLIWNFGGMNAANASEFLKYVEQRSDEMAIKIKKNNIAVSTTIWLMETLPQQKFDLDSLIRDVNLEYANPGLIEGSKLGRGWLPGNNSYGESSEVMNNSTNRENSEIFWKTYFEAIHIMTKSLIKNDVTIMAGTDANVPVCIPGFSLHDEISSLSKHGLSNSQVLYSATVAPGIWMNKNTGQIKEKYSADLVLLAKNPLEEIENTKSIESVFSGKYWLTRNTINKILDSIAKTNDENRNIDINEYLN